GAGLERVALPLAVHGLVHGLDQRALVVLGEQRIPVARPDYLDDVPARPREDRLELLDDLAVAAHRAVEALEVAVDHEREVVELLARGEGERPDRLGLVHLAVAEEPPYPARRGVGDPARLEVAVEARLIDRVDGAEAHRHGRELPDLGRQGRAREGGEALATR